MKREYEEHVEKQRHHQQMWVKQVATAAEEDGDPDRRKSFFGGKQPMSPYEQGGFFESMQLSLPWRTRLIFKRRPPWP